MARQLAVKIRPLARLCLKAMFTFKPASLFPRLSLALFAALLLSSCATGFRREWKAALQAGPQPGVVGAWEGTWNSVATGHHGRLRCVVSPAKNAQGDHSFHYHATWGAILSGAYRAEHRVTSAPGGTSLFNGQHRMPAWAGGLYTYEGTVKGDAFKAAYKCEADHGTYSMQRVK